MSVPTSEDGRATRVAFARQVIDAEARAIAALAELIGDEFQRAVDLVLTCRGLVVVSGVGKAGLIGQKLSSTLASTGTPGFFMHPADAIHGDLGRVQPDDLVLLLSNSGESEEVLRLIDPVRKIGARLVALTGRLDSRLARNADVVLDCGRTPEACPLGLAPTTSTAALLALGDALAMTVLHERGFNQEDYARYHPGGALGRSLLRVEEVMRSGDRLSRVPQGTTAGETLMVMNATPGRPGAAIVDDADGRLAGFFTDGDLARNLQAGVTFLEGPIDAVMIPDPVTIAPDRLASEALRILRERKIDQIPVVDVDGRAIGLLDVQDLLDTRIV